MSDACACVCRRNRHGRGLLALQARVSPADAAGNDDAASPDARRLRDATRQDGRQREAGAGDGRRRDAARGAGPALGERGRRGRQRVQEGAHCGERAAGAYRGEVGADATPQDGQLHAGCARVGQLRLRAQAAVAVSGRAGGGGGGAGGEAEPGEARLSASAEAERRRDKVEGGSGRR